MASPIPKPAALRQRRNRTTTAASLEAPAAAKIPLPAIRWSAITCTACQLPQWHHTRRKFDEAEIEPHDFEPRAIDWRPTTLAWWEVIWASPMAAEWVDADVPGLMALAILVDEYWSAPEPKTHAEMRQASREFGLSPLSRRQLQWEIKRLEGPKVAPPPAGRRTRGTLSVLSGKAS